MTTFYDLYNLQTEWHHPAGDAKLEAENAGLRKRIAELEASNAELRERSRGLDGESAEYRRVIETSYADYQRHITHLETRIAEWMTALGNCEKARADLLARIQETDHLLSLARKQVDERDAEIKALNSAQLVTCKWTVGDNPNYLIWFTGCGTGFNDGGPDVDPNNKFCPKCGRKIEIVKAEVRNE